MESVQYVRSSFICLFLVGLFSLSIGFASPSYGQEGEPEDTGTVEIDADDESFWKYIVGGVSAFADLVARIVKYVVCYLLTEIALPLGIFGLESITSTWSAVINPVLGAAGISDSVLYSANVFFPVAENFTLLIAFISFALAITVVRWILKFIPFIG